MVAWSDPDLARRMNSVRDDHGQQVSTPAPRRPRLPVQPIVIPDSVVSMLRQERSLAAIRQLYRLERIRGGQ